MIDTEAPMTLSVPVNVTMIFHADLSHEVMAFMLDLDREEMQAAAQMIVERGLAHVGIPAMLTGIDGTPQDIVGLTLDTPDES